MKNPKQINIPIWFRSNGVLYRRDCLPIDHPECEYNYVKNKLGLEPELFGIFHPLKEKYKNYSKEQLMSKICDLEITLNNIEF